MTDNRAGGARKPAIGVGVAYYGGMNIEHAHYVRMLAREGIPVFEIHDCAYSEIAKAEVLREAVSTQCECTIILSHNAEIDPEEIRAIARAAVESNSIYVRNSYRHSRFIHLVSKFRSATRTTNFDSCEYDVIAIPWTCLKRLIQSNSANEYSNTAIVDTVMSKQVRAFFSPWDTNGEPLGTLHYYLTPDKAFIERAREAGINVLSWLPQGGGSLKIILRETNTIKNNIASGYALCIPSFGNLDCEQQSAVYELQKLGMYTLELNGYPHIDQARAILVAQSDSVGAKGVMFIDHDIMFRPQDVLSVIAEAEVRQDPVAAVYNMRKTAHSLIGAIDVPHESEVTFFKGGKVYPALYSGLGFCAIPMGVFSDICDSHWLPALRTSIPEFTVRPYFKLDTSEGYYSGEDVSFCRKVQGLSVKHIKGEVTEGTPNTVDWDIRREGKGAGHRVWADTRIRIFHKGSYYYAIEDHSIAVPRYGTVKAKHVRTRAEARAMLHDASQLSPRAQERALGLDDGSTHPHAGLES